MIKPDFSDIQKNGFRINRFRLIFSKNLRPKNLNRSKEECVSKCDIIGERNLVINHLIEQNEICFTIYYLSLRLMFLFIIATTLSLLSRGFGFSLTFILALMSIIFFLIARKYRENFFLGDFGITFAESIYNAKINAKYNF
jgi:hypothetical protein